MDNNNSRVLAVSDNNINLLKELVSVLEDERDALRIWRDGLLQEQPRLEDVIAGFEISRDRVEQVLAKVKLYSAAEELQAALECMYEVFSDSDNSDMESIAAARRALLKSGSKSAALLTHRYVNFYLHCGKEWQDTWDSMCNDRCPVCDAEITPYKSDGPVLEKEVG